VVLYLINVAGVYMWVFDLYLKQMVSWTSSFKK